MEAEALPTLLDLVDHPQLGSKVLHCMDPRQPDGLLNLRCVSSRVKQSTEGHIVEVVTEGFFLWNREAEKKVPYFSLDLITPFLRVCMHIPRPPALPEDDAEGGLLGPRARSPPPATPKKVEPEKKNSWWGKFWSSSKSSKGEKNSPSSPVATGQETDSKQSVDGRPTFTAGNLLSEVNEERFCDEIERRLTPEVKYIGSQAFFGRDAFKNFEKVKTETNHVYQLPPFPSLLGYVTADRLPHLEGLKLSSNHFRCPEMTSAFLTDPQSATLLRQIRFLMLMPTEVTASKRAQKFPHTFVQRLLGSYKMTKHEVGALLRLCTGYSSGTSTPASATGGEAKPQPSALRELVMTDLSKTDIAAIVDALGDSMLVPQLEGIYICHSFLDEDKPVDNAQEDALCRMLVQGGQLKQLVAYLGHYETKPTYDPVALTLAANCKNLTRVYLPCWTVRGIRSVVQSIGLQLEVMDGSFLWKTRNSDVIASGRLIADSCPNVEKVLTLESHCSDSKEKDDPAAYFDVIKRVVTKCSNLRNMKWKARNLDECVSILKVGRNLTDISVQFDSHNAAALDLPLLASELVEQVGDRVELLELGTFRDYSVRAPEVVQFSDLLFTTLIAKQAPFTKLETLRLYSCCSVSVEAAFSWISAQCPQIKNVHITKPYSTNGGTVTLESNHPSIQARRGQNKILPSLESNPKLRSITYPKKIKDEDAKKEQDEPTILDGVDLEDHVKKIQASF